MNRIIVIPAAGRGSRLGSNLPKLLVPVNGRPMIDYLFQRYRDVASVFLLVVSPGAESAVRSHLKGREEKIEILVQESPTGMLDAILIPCERVRQLHPDEVWITWCDQVAVESETVRRLASLMGTARIPALGLPTVILGAPYIHFARHPDGGIAEVLHRREGDTMPEHGEGDIGLFALTAATYLDLLPQYAEAAPLGRLTGERNFLPFIPWLASRGSVRTIRATAPIEAIGINTEEELEKVSQYLGSGSR
ncbi:MAG: NTP transferase domain-containing protein [Gemmatimonadota bacterium]